MTKIKYYNENELCSVIETDGRHVTAENFTDDLVLLPFGVEKFPTYYDYEELLERRCFPHGRGNLDELLKKIGEPAYYPFDIIKKTGGRMAEDDIHLEIVDNDGNIYPEAPMNPAEDYADIEEKTPRAYPFTACKGNQTKYKRKGQWYKEDYLGYEAASEYLCSEILKKSNVADFVEYDLANSPINGEPVCVSPDFLAKGGSIYTFWDLWKRLRADAYSRIMDKLSAEDRIVKAVEFMENDLGIENAGPSLTTLLEFDEFTLNDDRHLNNIIFIRDKDGNFRFGPIFDNGGAFLSDTVVYGTESYDLARMIRRVKAKPFSTSFTKQADACRRLYGTQFAPGEIDEDRVFGNIAEFYGRKLSSRMKVVYSAQKSKYESRRKSCEVQGEG